MTCKTIDRKGESRIHKRNLFRQQEAGCTVKMLVVATVLRVDSSLRRPKKTQSPQ